MLAFLKKHYEKLILGVLLAVFILLLALQILLVRETGSIEVKEGDKVSYKPAAVYTADQQKEQRQKFNADKTFLTFKKWVPRNTGKEADSKFVDFVLPYPMTICPICRKAIPSNDFREKKSGTYYCSLSYPRHVLTPPMEIVQGDLHVDTDKDGIPDSYEKQMRRFNVNDREDAKLDFDNDFYTNLEEYYCNTDPLNATLTFRNKKALDAARYIGRLPYHNLLRVVDIKRKTYSFTLTNVNVPGNDPSKARFWVTVMEKRRIAGKLKDVSRVKSYNAGQSFVSLIDRIKILELVVGKTDPVTKRKEYRMKVKDEITGDVFTVGMREKARSQTVEVVLYSRTRVNDFTVKSDKEFVLGDPRTGEDKYKIVRINENDRSVVIRGKDGKDIRIGREMLINDLVNAEKEKKEKASRNPKQTSRERKI